MKKKTRTAVLIFSMWKQFSQQCGFGTSRACVHVNPPPRPPISVSLPNTTVIPGMLQSEWTAEAEECWARPHPPAPHLQPSAGPSVSSWTNNSIFHTCRRSTKNMSKRSLNHSRVASGVGGSTQAGRLWRPSAVSGLGSARQSESRPEPARLLLKADSARSPPAGIC